MSDLTITFDRSAAEDIVESFGWDVTDHGYLWGEDDAVLSIGGQPVHIDDFAGVVDYDGEPTPLRDDFNELVEYVKYRHENGGDDDH